MCKRAFLPAFAFLGLLAGTLPAQTTRGVVRGVVFAGNAEGPVKVEVTQHQDLCGDSVPNRHLQIANGRVVNALVVLEYRGNVDFGNTTVTLQNKDCDFQPTVQVAAPGATLIMENGDPIQHTMVLEQDGRNLGTIQVASGQQKKQKDALLTTGLLEVRCEFHDWMSANVWVLDHPYYAITSRDGSFSIGLIPSGTYRMKVWHEELGVLEKDIVIQGNNTTIANFSYQR